MKKNFSPKFLNMSKISNLRDFKKVTISVSLVDDAQIRTLNKKYLDRDHTTDVLSFNLDAPVGDETYNLGDIIVNVDQAERQASEFGNDLEHELAELTEHGVLHLLGVHHEEDDR